MAGSGKAPSASALRVVRLDHLVLSVAHVERSAVFYETICGMTRSTFDGGRIAMRFGAQKLNLTPRGWCDAPPPLDFCLVTHSPRDDIVSHLLQHGITELDGPHERSGALGRMHSIYVHDPDGNIVELATYEPL